MKKFLPLFCAMFLAFSFSSTFAKTYINGIDPNFPPFAYVDEKTGQAAGFDVDSMNWIAKKMGFEIEHKPMAWDGIIPALLANQIDMICSGMSITPERAKMVQFSDPYWQVSRVFITPKDSTLTVEEIFKTPIKLGMQRGTSEAKAMKAEKDAKGYPFEIRFYDSSPLAIEDLLNGRIQAAFMEELPADDSISKGRAIKKIGSHGKPNDYGVAIRKKDTELRKLIDQGYKKLIKDPYWQELQKKYLNK